MSTSNEQTSLAEASRDPLRPYYSEFQEYLRQSGLSRRGTLDIRGAARHFLVWLEQDCTKIEAIDDAVLRRFRDHDCRCPGPRYGYGRTHAKGSRARVSGVFRLVRFFEQSGRIKHSGSDGMFRQLDRFLKHLAAEGYSTVTLQLYRGVCRHFIVWLQQSRIAVKEIDTHTADRFLHHDCLCQGFRHRRTGPLSNGVAVKRFIGFLAAWNLTRDDFVDSWKKPDDDLTEFRTWLRRHRGIQEITIDDHVREVRKLLPELGDHPCRYDAALIRDAMLRHFEQVAHTQARRASASLRMYLRFLTSIGACASGLVGAVPSAPVWRLATLPRYIPASDIERVIDSCDTETPAGIRDRTILLLLARLALRAGDVVRLKLADVDWVNARIIVCGKSKRSVGLPLPQDVGDAMLAYIEKARPRVNEDRLFLRVLAPHRPLSRSSAISAIVSRALNRAEIDNANTRGAHLFRHSAATAMLREGASLQAIGALLRHRSLDTTAVYAKVDHPMLQEVSESWIGDIR